MSEQLNAKETISSKAEIKIGFGKSEGGKRGIKMDWGEEKWYLLTVKRAPLADNLRTELQNSFQVTSIAGMAFDEYASLKKGELILMAEKGAVGVYVSEKDFDSLRSKGIR